MAFCPVCGSKARALICKKCNQVKKLTCTDSACKHVANLQHCPLPSIKAIRG